MYRSGYALSNIELQDPSLRGMMEDMTPKNLFFSLLLLVVVGLVGAYFLSRSVSISGPNFTPQSDPSSSSEEVTENGQYYEISASFPSSVALSESATPSAKASSEAVIDAWVKETIATFKTNSNLESLSEEDIRIQGLDQGRKYDLSITYEAYEGPATISYIFLIYEDTLGAHPNAYYRSFTFDAVSGKELRIADVFESGTYLETLSRISRELLTPQIAQATQTPESELDTSYLETGTTPDPNNFQVFYLDSTNLVIVFPPYQVGPWVLGTQTVLIPRAELETELKAGYR
jgi:hypothetical protein